MELSSISINDKINVVASIIHLYYSSNLLDVLEPEVSDALLTTAENLMEYYDISQDEIDTAKEQINSIKS